MKKYLLIFITCLYLIFSSVLLKAQYSLEKIWETEATFQFAEGIVFEPEGKFLYISNTVGNPMEKDGKGTISTLDLEGNVIKHDIVTGMNAPKDIQRYKNLIYAADLNELVVIDIDKEEIVNRIAIEGAKLLHNIAIDKDGIVYVSDMFAGKVHRVEDDKPSLYLDSLGYAAGLLFLGSDLYVLTGGDLIKADKNKNLTTITSGMDGRTNGLQMVKENEFLVTCWSGMVYYVKADGTNELLLDMREERVPGGINLYNQKTGIMYMSTDQNNTICAYKLKQE